MSYLETDWNNDSSPAISRDNLNKMERALAGAAGFDTADEIRALGVPSTLYAVVLKGLEGGFFVWDSSSDADEDGVNGSAGTVINPTGNTIAGRWVREVHDGTFTPEMFGAKGDYYNDDGSVNSSPTDDTLALQAAIDATRGNGAVLLSRFYLTTLQLLNPGVITLKSPLSPTLYAKSSDGIERPFGIINKTTHIFVTDPNNSQSAYQFTGLTFIGDGTSDQPHNATTNLFDTSGQTTTADYFNFHAEGCDFYGFDIAIDGSLGSWLWKIKNCGIAGRLGMHLTQPHGAIIEGCGFNWRNNQDLYAYGGVALSFINNAHDFDVNTKEKGLVFDTPQGMEYAGNYAEQYDYLGVPENYSNGGRGTDVVTFIINHYTPNNIPIMRNNYYAAGLVQRLITLKRDSSSEGFHTETDLRIYENTVNGLGGDYIYHDDSTTTGSLTMPKPIINTQHTSYTIADPSGTLKFYGSNAKYIVKSSYTSPSGTITVEPDDGVNSEVLRDDKLVTVETDGRIGLATNVDAFIEVTYKWESATSADFYIQVSDTTGFPQIGSFL